MHKGIKDVPGLVLPKEAGKSFSTWWLYTVLVGHNFGIKSRLLTKAEEEKGIQSRPLWHLFYGLTPFQDFQAYRTEVAERFYQRPLSLPSSPNLGRADQGRVMDRIWKLGAK